MEFIIDFVKEFAFETIFAVLGISLIPFIINQFKLFIRHNNSLKSLKELGIKNIFTEGKHTKSMDKIVPKSEEIKIMAITGYSFLNNYRTYLQPLLSSGKTVRVLLANPQGEFIKEGSSLQYDEKHFIEQIAASIHIISSISKNVNRGNGTVEIRYYNSEFRNSAIICGIKAKNTNRLIYHTWLSAAVPPMRAIDSMQIEYIPKHDCIVNEHFDSVWEKYEATSAKYQAGSSK